MTSLKVNSQGRILIIMLAQNYSYTQSFNSWHVVVSRSAIAWRKNASTPTTQLANNLHANY